MRPRRRQRDDLGVDALLVEHGLAVRDVAMPGDHDVVVAGIVDDRIAVGVDGDVERTARRRERVEVFGRVIVIMEVDDGHGRSIVLRGSAIGDPCDRVIANAPVRGACAMCGLIRGH